MTFNDWLRNVENFGTREERFLEHTSPDLIKWLEAAYRKGRQDECQELETLALGSEENEYKMRDGYVAEWFKSIKDVDK